MTRNEFKELLSSNKTANEIKAICEKYWYEADSLYIEFNSPRVWVRALDYKCKYYPDVRLRTPILAKSINPEERKWEINSWCLVNMDSREFKTLLYYFNQALRMVEELNEVDLSKLPVIPEKFEEDEDNN